MKTYIIAISFADNTEYWNSSLVNDENTTQHIDSAEGLETLELAELTLNKYVKPYAKKKGWKVSFLIEEYNFTEE